MWQNKFRKIQREGLQVAYNDENDGTIKNTAQKLCSLAFVPEKDVVHTFELLLDEIPEDFSSADYFDTSFYNNYNYLIYNYNYQIIYSFVMCVEERLKEEGKR